MAEQTIYDKILDVNPRIIFIAVFVILMIPFLFPLGIPVKITDYVIEYRDAMDDVPEGGTVWMSLDSAIGGMIETGGSMVVTAKYFTNDRPDVHIIFVGMHYDSLLAFKSYIQPIVKDREYGVDYVWLGYIPGADAAISKLADDIKGIIYTDFEGTPVSELPIMDNINNANDIDLLFSYDTYGHAWSYVGHWQARYNTKIALGPMTSGLSTAAMYFTAGQIVGLVAGTRGSAELEQLTGYLGFASSTVDALNLGLILVLVLLVICNVGYWGKRLTGVES